MTMIRADSSSRRRRVAADIPPATPPMMTTFIAPPYRLRASTTGAARTLNGRLLARLRK